MKKVLTIVLVGLLTYLPSFFNDFVWDVKMMYQSKEPMPVDAYFRPVMSAVYSTFYNIFGPRPFFFHFFQLIFHIITAILIFYLFKRFFKETFALILTLIFLVHPANVEAVSFAMQEITFTLIGLIGLYLFVISENHSIKRIFLSTVLLLIALLMKETAIVLFPLVFCYLVLFKRKQNNFLVSYSIFAVILLMVYILARISGGNLYVQGQGLFPIMRVPLATRLINIPSIIQYYFSMFFYPINLAIAQHWVIKSPNFINFFLPLILEILFFLSALIYSIKKKDKVFFFFFLWFVVGLLPHLQIVPLNMTVAERWLYFPMIGILGMIGVVLSKMELRQSKLLVSLGIIIILLFSIRSFIRTLDWHNNLTLFGHDIEKTSSFDLQNNFGSELLKIGRYDEAKKYFEISTHLAPYWWINWNNLGVSYAHEKNYQKAIEYFQKAIDNGHYYLAYINLAKTLVYFGNDQKRTEELLKESLRLFPKDKDLQYIQAYFQQKVNHPVP